MMSTNNYSNNEIHIKKINHPLNIP